MCTEVWYLFPCFPGLRNNHISGVVCFRAFHRVWCQGSQITLSYSWACLLKDFFKNLLTILQQTLEKLLMVNPYFMWAASYFWVLLCWVSGANQLCVGRRPHQVNTDYLWRDEWVLTARQLKDEHFPSSHPIFIPICWHPLESPPGVQGPHFENHKSCL